MSTPLSLGQHIAHSQPGALQPIGPEALFGLISAPDAALLQRCQQVREAARLGKAAADAAKRQLPYFCCARFHEGLRRGTHFADIAYCVLDLDHCHESPGQFAELRARLRADERVMMLFASPSGQGLKLLFALDSPIADTKVFSDFYKAFALQFGKQHGLAAYIDLRTHDATRACFLNADPEAYFNPLCEPLRWDWIAQAGHLQAAQAQADSPGLPAKAAAHSPAKPAALPAAEGADEDPNAPYRQIADRLFPRQRPPVRSLPVPAEVTALQDRIRPVLEGYGMSVLAIVPIQYGEKWRIAHQQQIGELNVYFGQKRGFSVVPTPRRDTNEALNALLAKLFTCAIFDPEHPMLWPAPPSDT